MARTVAMFTDVSLCIGCRACQVACKQWNQLEAEEPEWTGTYQNHAHFTDKTYRLVRFMEEKDDKGALTWNLMSDVCKHCAKACPTESIQFGFRDELSAKARKRVEELKKMGYKDAQLYGEDQNGPLGGLNAFFLLLDKPSGYGLPEKPRLPQNNVLVDSLLSIGSALLVGIGAMVAFRERGGKE